MILGSLYVFTLEENRKLHSFHISLKVMLPRYGSRDNLRIDILSAVDSRFKWICDRLTRALTLEYGGKARKEIEKN